MKQIILNADSEVGTVRAYLHEDGQPEECFLSYRDLSPTATRVVRDAVRATAVACGFRITGTER